MSKLSEWSEIIRLMGVQSRTRTQTLTNASCVRCGCVNKYMLRLGAIVMCEDCCRNQFGQLLYYEPKSIVYKLWRQQHWEEL